MQKLRIKSNKRGVSPVIATLLLIAIAVAASIVTYTWTMSMAQNQSTQSQTNVKIDQVLFGKAEAASEIVTACSVDLTQLTFADASVFSVGDDVQVHLIGVVLNNFRTVTAVNTDTNIITLDPALELEATMDNTDVVGATVSKIDMEGLWISTKNTGSIAATIDVVYIYDGDQLISSINVDDVLSAGATKDIGLIDADLATSSTSYWGSLKSGGHSLPSADNTYSDDFGGILPNLDLNSPYTVRLITTTGFVVEGTFYTPGSWT